MFQRDRSNNHKSVLGFSALEMMVAMGILATIFILAMPFFSQQGKIIKEMRTSASCQAVLDTAFSRINSLGNSLDSYAPSLNASLNNVKGTTAATLRAYQLPTKLTTSYSFDPDFSAQRQKMFNLAGNGGALYTENPGKTIKIPQSGGGTKDVPIQHDGVTLYTPLLLKGSMEYLATKFNSGYCNTYGPANLLTSVDKDSINSQVGGLKNLSMTMKINRYDLSSSAVNNSCGLYWPRPRNGAGSNVTYEPQFGYSPQTRQIIGIFPSWMVDTDGMRVSLRASFTNDKGQTENCEGTKDFSLPQDKQNVIDYFYDVNYVKTSAAYPGAIVDNTSMTNGMRVGTSCSPGSASCLSHPFETILTNLQPYSKNPLWPENRDRPLCSQTPSNYMSLVISFRVYNMQKENGAIPMCLDTSYQWFKETKGNWCPGSYNGGAETSFDKTWDTRYTGWVPCEHMQFCNSRPDRVTVTQGTATNFKFPGSNSPQPYTEYRYYYDKISGDKNNPRMWGCEMKFGIAILDLAGNLSYTPAQEKMTDSAGIGGDRRPPVKEINPHVYFKPPPCYTCNCKPCKGGKGLFGGLFNWILFAVLVIVSMGTAFAIVPMISVALAVGATVGAICYSGALGCSTGGGKNYAPDTSGGKYRSCDDSNNGCKCGKKCSQVKPPSPGWSAPLDDAMDISQLEKNSCVPGNTFYVDGVAQSSLNGIKPMLGYKTPKTSGTGFDYMMDPTEKVNPGDELMYSVFDSKNAQFCYVAVRCAGGKFQVIKESSDIPGDNTLYPLRGCYPVKVGRTIGFTGTSGITKGGNACLEVQFNTGPQNPQNHPLWAWSNYNEQCGVTTATGAVSSDPRVVAGSCPTTSTTIIPGAQYSNTGAGCSNPTADANDLNTVNFACKSSKLYWDPCAGTSSKNGTMSCPKYCYADCKVPDYIPEHPWMDAPHNMQRYYEPMTSADAKLPFCTMDRTVFDATL